MKRKYIIHPGDYAIGENEKLYADMAAKGWLLEKRGAFFSRFRRDVPQRLRYRLELIPSDLFEDEFPDEQRVLYEDAGWRYVTGGVRTHVFSAPEGSGAPELHTDPRQQAETLRGLRRKYYFGWIPSIAILLLDFAPMAFGRNGVQNIVGMLGMQWITNTALFTLFALYVIWSVYGSLYGAWHISRLRRTLKQGRPMDHAPKHRQRLHRAANAAFLAGCIVFAALSIVQLALNGKYDMPTSSDGPYLLLTDLGWDGTRTTGGIEDVTTSYVKTKHSLLADQWHTYECVSAHGENAWMYQDVYALRGVEAPGSVVSLLMANSTFTRSVDGFARIDVAGLEAAYKGHSEYIAVKGNVVYRIVYSDPASYGDQETKVDVLGALAKRIASPEVLE